MESSSDYWLSPAVENQTKLIHPLWHCWLPTGFFPAVSIPIVWCYPDFCLMEGDASQPTLQWQAMALGPDSADGSVLTLVSMSMLQKPAGFCAEMKYRHVCLRNWGLREQKQNVPESVCFPLLTSDVYVLWICSWNVFTLLYLLGSPFAMKRRKDDRKVLLLGCDSCFSQGVWLVSALTR